MSSNSEIDSDKPDNDKLLEAWKLLQSAIRRAPIAEIQEHIVGAKGIKLTKNFLLSIRDKVDDAFAWASLGDEEAIKELTYIGNKIAVYLAEISKSGAAFLEKEKTKVAKVEPVETEADTSNWFEELNRAADDLLRIPAESLHEAFGKLISDLPEAEFSFPIRALLDAKTFPLSLELQTVSALCDALIQKRVESERAWSVQKLTAESACWPISVTATDYHKKRAITDILPGMKLGSSLGISPKEKSSESAASNARWLHRILDAERKNPFLQEELKRLDDPMVVSAAEQLHERLREYRNFTSDERRLYVDHLEWSFVPNDDGTYPFAWDLGRHWRRMAAQLPPLNKGTVEAWVEAGFAYIAFRCEGNLEDVEWSEAVNKAIAHTGGLSGIRRALRQGFSAAAPESLDSPVKKIS